MRTRIIHHAFLALIFVFAASLPVSPARAQSTLEDVFKKTLDELMGKKPSSPGQNGGQNGKGLNGQNGSQNGAGRNGGEGAQEAGRVPGSREEITLSFAPLVREAAPSVVNVYAARKVRQRSPFEGDPFFDRFFGNKGGVFGQPRERIEQSLGSGVIVAEDGIILTNHHVIADADDVKIALNDGSEYECDILLKDEKSDLAVLKVRDGGSFKAIGLANSDGVEVGDLVLAIGNPFGVGQTVTSGIVSAVARSRVGINDFDFFIQTDAAINPGNSGGALIDMKGRLIGINTAIYTRSGGSIGLGFAIPSNMAEVVLRSALSGGKVVERPWMGADLQEVTPDIAESLGMRRPGGVLVASVFKGGPADRAGLEPGDVIVGINRNIVDNGDALAYRLDTIGIGGTAELVVISGGERKVAKLRLEKAPETTPREETLMPETSVFGGATVANLSPAVAQEVGARPDRSGAVVVDVSKPSRAAANGVLKGDIILAINGVEVGDVADVANAVSRESRRGWQVVLERRGRQIVFERNGGFFRQYIR